MARIEAYFSSPGTMARLARALCDAGMASVVGQVALTNKIAEVEGVLTNNMLLKEWLLQHRGWGALRN